MSDLRWDVETRPNDYDDVGAASAYTDGGCLVFTDADGTLLVAYAAGTWRSVSLGEGLEAKA